MFKKIMGWFKPSKVQGEKYAVIYLRTVKEFVMWDGSLASYNYPDSHSLLKIHDGLKDLKVGSWWDGVKWIHPKE